MNTKPMIANDELLRRLEAREQTASKYGGFALINPDGPEAKARIKALEAALGKLEHLIARQALTGGKP